MKDKYYKGKIGYCDGTGLGLNRGHYVYIRNCINGNCEINTFTSLKDNDGHYEIGKIRRIENGFIYPVPKNDVDLRLFSGVDKRIIKNVPVNKIRIIKKKRIKSRHKFYINKYMK